MFDWDKWQEIFYTIRKNKARTFLTALGVFWGIFMLMLLIGSGKGMENGVLGLFGDRAINSLYVWAQRTSMPYKGYKAGRRARFNNNDMQALQDRFSEIKYIAPRYQMGSQTFERKGKTQGFEFSGEAPDYNKIEPFGITEGRWLNQKDLDEKRKIVVIGRRIRDIFFEEDEQVIGDYINIGNVDYKIVGVYKVNARGGDAAEKEQSAFIPITTGQQLFNQPNRVHWFVCAMHEDVNVSVVQGRLKSLLRERHNIHPDDEEGIGSWNAQKEFEQFTGLFAAINLFVWIVGIGSLIAGIVGVSNVMLIVVKERTRELGIRKSMGATPSSIIGMILQESVFITLISGYLGLLVGTGFVFGIGKMFEQFNIESDFFANPEIDLRTGVLALIFLVIAGAAAGLVPALQASRVNPVIALKDE
jgi:putative ABC transport system permease protein